MVKDMSQRAGSERLENFLQLLPKEIIHEIVNYLREDPVQERHAELSLEVFKRTIKVKKKKIEFEIVSPTDQIEVDEALKTCHSILMVYDTTDFDSVHMIRELLMEWAKQKERFVSASRVPRPRFAKLLWKPVVISALIPQIEKRRIVSVEDGNQLKNILGTYHVEIKSNSEDIKLPFEAIYKDISKRGILWESVTHKVFRLWWICLGFIICLLIIAGCFAGVVYGVKFRLTAPYLVMIVLGCLFGLTCSTGTCALLCGCWCEDESVKFPRKYRSSCLPSDYESC
jgi:hypothetical protein